MQPLRYGILGSGFMGRTHAEAIRHLPGARLMAIAGGSRAPALAADYGATLCASAEELVARDDIDAVIITTPQFAHASEALLAAAHDKHLFIEKPMTTTVADAGRIIDMDAYDKLQIANNGIWQTVAQQPPVNPEQANTAFQQPRMQAYIDQLAIAHIGRASIRILR